jgi:hypothetical protein
MGIDRIGRTPPPVPDPEPSAASRAGSPTSPGGAFPVSHPLSSSEGQAVDPTRSTGVASTPLQRFRADEIDLHGYVDAKVQEATAHLSALPPAELASIRSALRDRMVADPALGELLQTATGQTPSPDDD